MRYLLRKNFLSCLSTLIVCAVHLAYQRH